MKTAKEYFKEEWGNGFIKATLSEEGAIFEMSMDDIYNTMESFASQPKWISVEERLPEKTKRENSDKVLVFKTDINGNKGTALMSYNHLQGFWNTMTGTCKVTHWQPLPTPPTK